MFRRIFLFGFLLILPLPAAAGGEVDFPFKNQDRVAWIGSSSTNIGVWPKTMEFLLRTRHPELQLTFKRHSTGGGTFATGLQNIDKWLADSKPTLVFFNYGTNDAAADAKGLPAMKDNLLKCVAKAKTAGARVVLMNFQAADVRKSGAAAAQRRQLYAQAMLNFAKEKDWPPLVDVFHPLADLQKKGQQDDDKYTILRDTIHCTDPAYIAWGYFLYERLKPQATQSSATLTVAGKIGECEHCEITDVKADGKLLSFIRHDHVLPLLPPVQLPPRKHVPLEKWSAYQLRVTGLSAGSYEIRCEGKTIGIASAGELAQGVNLNTMLLDSKQTSPWETLARQIWEGKSLDQIGKTRWRFEVQKTS